MKIVKLVVCILFGLIFLNSGLNKFFNYMPMPELTEEQKNIFSAFMKIAWLMPLTGAVEIIGGILVMLPKYRALGAIVILPVMAGILAHHTTMDRSGLVMALVLAAVNLWIILDNWKKYKPMIG